MDKLGRWAGQVGLKAAGAFGLVIVGGLSASLATNGVTGALDNLGVLAEIAVGSAAVKVLIPAAMSLLKKAEQVEPGDAPDGVFGSIMDD